MQAPRAAAAFVCSCSFVGWLATFGRGSPLRACFASLGERESGGMAISGVELGLEDRGEVLGELEGVDGDLDGGDVGRLEAFDGALGAGLLELGVLVFLGEEVAEPVGVLGHACLDALGLGVVDELAGVDLGAVGRENGRAAAVARAAISLDAHLRAGGVDQGEVDAGEVGAAVEGEALGPGRVLDLHVGERLGGHAEKLRRERELVDGHVLEEALRVPGEALAEGLLGVVVPRLEDEPRAGVRLERLERALDVARDVLDEPHEHRDPRRLGLGRHRLQLRDRRGPGLLQEDVRRAGRERRPEQLRVVHRPSRDQRDLRRPDRPFEETLARARREPHVLPRLDHLGLKRRAARGRLPAAEEPRLHDVAQPSRRARPFDQLEAVEPPHPAPGQPAPDHRVVRLGLGAPLGAHRRLRSLL
mmetsp:Transcript_10463/g.33462  ORF Transcript_10463/g.33462 Transcript_10463/m.33462 type:complete len:418 (+) Transcript_10463:418-1671(+)